MAWVTTLGPNMRQINYRLNDSAGCGQAVAADVQLGYRMDDSATALRWIGEGLAEFGIRPGTAMTEADKEAAVLLADGRDPTNKDVLVERKKAVAPEAKLPAAPLAAAVATEAADRGMTVEELLAERPRVAKRFAQLQRGLSRDEDRHQAPVRDLERIARAAGIDIDAVYDAKALNFARDHAEDRVTIGNRGFDLTLNIAKSFSVLHGLADDELAGRLHDIYDQAVTETVAAMETWASYAMRGHHGDQQTAQRIATTGFLGWTMTHHTARPVDDADPDPHLHVHVTIANLVRGVDGKWSAPGAGGRDIHRHVHAAGAFLDARLRALTAQHLGVRWEPTGAGCWEIIGIDERLRDLFSKRAGQVRKTLADAGLDPAQASHAQEKLAAEVSRDAKDHHLSLAELRQAWRAQAAEAGIDIDAVIAAAVPGTAAAATEVDVEAIAAAVFDPDAGLTAHTKSFTRADALAAVAENAPAGVATTAELEDLCDRVLASPFALRLARNAGAAHLSNAQRYSTVDIAEAEAAILTAARDRRRGAFARLDTAAADTAVRAFEHAVRDHSDTPFELSAEQRAVVLRLATSGYGLDAIIGAAGTGKTTIMRALAAVHATAGHRIAGASTAAAAAHHLQADTGIASATIASWLKRIDTGPGLDGVDVLVIDEAGMVDDRQLARLVAEAGRTGTQLVGIGDPKQLTSPGVGSTFTDVHGIVDGLYLYDNRRQQHETHRAALAQWRDGGRREALTRLADAGCIHAADTLDDAHAAMVGDWDTVRRAWTNPYDAIDKQLMLGGTNADVDTLNHACQAIRVAAGELDATSGYRYRVTGGARLHLHHGDVVAARVNDYRRPGPSVLNGFRGIITGIDRATGDVTVTWRETTPDGQTLHTQTVTADYIRKGGLSLGYAMTVHKGQGQTAESVSLNLTGLEPNAAYVALSRHRDRLRAWIARDVLEDDTVRARLGEARTTTDKLHRAIDAYAAYINRPEPEPLAIAELGDTYAHLLRHRPPPATTTRPEPTVDATAGPRPRPARWWLRRFGAYTDDELHRRTATVRTRLRRSQPATAAPVPEAVKTLRRDRDALLLETDLRTEMSPGQRNAEQRDRARARTTAARHLHRPLLGRAASPRIRAARDAELAEQHDNATTARRSRRGRARSHSRRDTNHRDTER